MKDLWLELEKLRKEIDSLEKQIARQRLRATTHPAVKCGTIKAVGSSGGNTTYEIQERNVSDEKDDTFVEVRTIPKDASYGVNQTVAFCLDDNGERFILPSATKLILVQDVGSNKAKEVIVDEAGNVTTPSSSETLDYVVAEPLTNFHNSTPPTKTGRIYPALKAVKADNVTNFYIVFVEGHGDVAKIFVASANIQTATTLTFTVSVDGQGNVISIGLTAG